MNFKIAREVVDFENEKYADIFLNLKTDSVNFLLIVIEIAISNTTSFCTSLMSYVEQRFPKRRFYLLWKSLISSNMA